MKRAWLGALAVAAACAAPAAPVAPTTCETCVDLFVAAHEDDDLLFMNPDISEAIAADHEVTVAYTTAGDLGDANYDAYWIDRERGILQAYSFLVSGVSATEFDPQLDAIAPGWTPAVVDLAGFEAVRYTRDHVALVFLRLSDYQERCLWGDGSNCSSLNTTPSPPYVAYTRACPGNAPACPAGTTLAEQAVTRDEWISVLAALLESTGAQTLHALDASDLHVALLGQPVYIGSDAGYTDHDDHVFSARFAVEAATRVTPPPAVKLYRGYTLHRAAVNLADDVAHAKQDAFVRYAIFDDDIVRPPTPGTILSNMDKHVAGDYKVSAPGSWQRREIATATLAPALGRLATDAGSCLGADLSAVACSGAPTWQITASHAVQLAGTSSCLSVGSAPAAALAPCGSSGTTVFAFDTGQLRAGGDGCFAQSPGAALAIATCAAKLDDLGRVADVPVDAQAWLVTP